MNGDDTPASLAVLGVDAAAEQLYRAVLRAPGSPIEFLADRMGWSATQAAETLQVLIDNRLVTVGKGLVQPEQPQVALGRLLSREFRQLAAAQAALTSVRLQLAHYEAEHQAGLRPGSPTVVLDVVDPGDIPDTLEWLVESTVGEMLFLRPEQWRTPMAGEIDAMVARALSAGRAGRAIYPVEALDALPDRVRRRIACGERVRLLPQVPARLGVFGESAALLPQDWHILGGPGLLVRQPGLVAALHHWFEQLWRCAVDLPRQGAPGTADGRAQLLQLLVSGVKDERIARALGVSLRTVRRRIADLLAELGVDSRFAAGAEAVRRGLV